MRRLVNFVFYNNGFVILVLLVVLGSGSALAASPNVRNGVISSEQKLIKIDNSYIRDVNLSKHNFSVKITKVEKDDENYYLSYDLNTIELVDGAWKKIVTREVLTINIEQLGERDLGLYAAEELNELVSYTKTFLAEVQLSEKNKGETQKTLNKTYKGLIGRFLESEEITFAGYDPVIEPPVIVPAELPEVEENEPREEISLELVIEEFDDDQNNTASTSATTTAPILPSDTTPPEMVLVGEKNMEIELQQGYIEAGAVANDDRDGDLTAMIEITGTVDTNTLGDYLVTYSVVDQSGNRVSLTREIRVKEASANPAEPEVDLSDETTATTTN